MVRAVIVEDEVLILERIRILIEKSGLPIIIAGTSRNGRDALNLILDENPDVAFVDIMMPVMDGLELALEIQERRRNTRVVVVTGYDKFEFAQKALRYGVSDYLLKPLDRDEFNKLLQRLIKDVERRKEDVAHEIIRGADARHDLFARLIEHPRHEMMPKSITERVAEYRIDVAFIPYIVLVMNKAALPSPLQSDELSKPLETWEPGAHAQIVTLTDYHLALIMGNIHGGTHGDSERLRQEIVEVLRLSPGMPVGISEMYNDIYALPKACTEARNSHRQDFLHNHSLKAKKGSVDTVDMAHELASIREALLILLRTKETEEVLSLVDSVHATFERVELEFSDFSSFVTEIRLAAAQAEREQGTGPVRDAYSSYTAADLADVLGSMDRVFAYLKNHLLLLMKSAEMAGGAGRTIISIRKYIDANYRRSITVESIAEMFGLNASYVSSAFKKTVGQSFTHYVTMCRLNGAKEYLETDDSTVQEAAFQNGFSDPYYFSKVFKKQFGVSPSRYVATRRSAEA